MMLYSKNGSIPKPQTDGTDGWIEVPNPPTAPEGKEVIWWYPPGWVIRGPMPPAEAGYVWSWSQSESQWMKIALQPVVSAVPIQQDPIIQSDNSSTTTLVGGMV